MLHRETFPIITITTRANVDSFVARAPEISDPFRTIPTAHFDSESFPTVTPRFPILSVLLVMSFR